MKQRGKPVITRKLDVDVVERRHNKFSSLINKCSGTFEVELRQKVSTVSSRSVSNFIEGIHPNKARVSLGIYGAVHQSLADYPFVSRVLFGRKPSRTRLFRQSVTK